MHDTVESSVAPQEIIQAMKLDFNVLASVVMPEVYKFPYPDYYLALSDVLLTAADKERDFSQYAVGLPRGFAKTTWLKVLVAHYLFFTKKRFILIVQATDRMAENFLADIQDILDHPNTVALFGDWRRSATKTTKQDIEFSILGRSVKIVALGAGSSLRGIVRKGQRPDLQLMDDIQSREDAESQVISDKLLNWMLGTLMYTKSPFGCQYIFVGNMYPTEHCILKKLVQSPDWLTFVTGAILADGTSLWPELYPVESLHQELRSAISMGKREIFFSEKQNDPSLIPKTKFDSTKVIKKDPAANGDLHQGNFIVIDPAGAKKKSDFTAIGYFERYDGKPHFAHYIEEVLTPKQTILRTLELAQQFNCSLIVVEDVAYQSTLLFWFNEILEKFKTTLGNITVLPINPRGVSKNARILAMFNQLLAGDITLAPGLATQVFHLIHKFDPSTTKNVDDVLDLLAYSSIVTLQYGHLLTVPDAEALLYEDTPEVMSEYENSPI